MWKRIIILLCIVLLPVTALCEDAANLEIELEIMTGRLTRANEELETLYQELAALKLQLQKHEQQSGSVNAAELAEAKAQNETLSDSLKTLQQELAVTKAALDTMTAQRDKALMQLSQAEAALDALSVPNDEASRRLAEAALALVAWEEELLASQEKLDEQEKELFAAQNELKLSQQELANAIVLMEQQRAELNANRIALPPPRRSWRTRRTPSASRPARWPAWSA